MTMTVEAYISANGRALQAATSHHLGDNFAKMFEITFEDERGQKQYAQQTSWGLSTRSIGAIIMVHGDNAGLVLPPRVAPVQVIIIPIPSKADSADTSAETIEAKCEELCTILQAANIRTKVDKRANYTPGWKYNHWERKGVPLRLEVGVREMKQDLCRLVRRDTGAKQDSAQVDIDTIVSSELTQMQADMLQKATKERDSNIVKVTSWDAVMPALNQGKLILAPWCETIESEENIRRITKELSVQTSGGDTKQTLSGSMKSLCIPLEQPPLESGTLCFHTNELAKRWCLFGRSY